MSEPSGRPGPTGGPVSSSSSIPDRTTRREALELELMEEGRSEAGEEIGDEAD